MAVVKYPLFFEEIYMPYIWGGRRLETMLGKRLPASGIYAESWEISTRPEGESKIRNGAFAGKTLTELVAEYPHAVLGEHVAQKYGALFPLLVKFLDVSQPFSVQVHPDDAAARRLENERFGKTEGWYVLHAEEKAELIYGLRSGVTREAFAAAAHNDIERVLQRLPAKTGDFFFLRAGTVHASLGGMLIYEVQQNSNTTYRIFDWNRVDSQGKGRPLHVEKALEVIDYGVHTPPPPGEWQQEQQNRFRYLTRNEYFIMTERTIAQRHLFPPAPQSFRIVTVLQGAGLLRTEKFQQEIKRGNSFLLPADLPEAVCEGELHFIETQMV